MRTMLALLLGWSLGFTIAAQSVRNPVNGVPYATNGVLAEIDFEGNGQVDASYVLEVIGNNIVLLYFHDDERATYLASGKKTADFESQELISKQTRSQSEALGRTGVSPDYYAWDKSFFFGIPRYDFYRVSGGQFPTLTNALVGLRFFGNDNFYHHAWIRLTRPDNVPGTPFLVDSHDYNPLPDEPIGAGLPPPVPPLTFTVSTDGFLLLSWTEKAVPYYKLQSRPDLFDPDSWQDVPTGEEPTFTAPLDGEAGYYRLTRR